MRVLEIERREISVLSNESDRMGQRVRQVNACSRPVGTHGTGRQHRFCKLWNHGRVQQVYVEQTRVHQNRLAGSDRRNLGARNTDDVIAAGSLASKTDKVAAAEVVEVYCPVGGDVVSGFGFSGTDGDIFSFSRTQLQNVFEVVVVKLLIEILLSKGGADLGR